MKGNQGLEALAALCGGQSDAPTEEGVSHGASKSAMDTSGTSTGSGSSQGERSQTAPQSPPGQKAALQVHRPAPSATQQSTVHSITPQHWQKAMAATAAIPGGAVAQNFLVQAGVPTPQQNVGDNAAFAAMQQLAYYQYIQAQAKFAAQHAAQTIAGGANGAVSFVDQQALAMALAGKAQAHQSTHVGAAEVQPKPPQQMQVIPTPAAQHGVSNGSATNGGSQATTTMKPPPPPSQTVPSLPSTLSTAGLQGTTAHPAIAPLPSAGKIMPSADASAGTGPNSDDKKQQKRAANRRSAQLSRKRKKQFIEELKEENDELRRKEQILRSIPDLIVVFDSSGKLWFVSQSVTRFLDMTPEELEGTSFWDRLCEDSVRLLKAAFMDSLAAKKSDSDTAPLGPGLWELILVDKDSSYKAITLNGVVHFSGDAPECVCCIRPRDQESAMKLAFESKATNSSKSRVVSSSDGSHGSRSSVETSREAQTRNKPKHLDVNNENSGNDSVQSEKAQRARADPGRSANREAVRISDGDSGSMASSSGSDDGIA